MILTVGATIETVRVPELTPYSVYGDITVNDQLIMYMAAYNKTVRAPIVDIRTWILTGGGISHPPILTGNAMVVQVSALEAGGKIFSIPSIAGKQFILRRSGIGALDPATDYEILDAGGFKLLRTDDILTLDEIFELQFFGSTPTTGVPGTATSGSLFTGIKSVSANTTLGPSDVGKLIQMRGTTSALTLTLPAVETIPDNTIIVIETLINNTKQHTINTSGGQFIYFGNTTHTAMYMGISETLWFYRADDGYYLLASKGNFETIGAVSYGYKVGLNELVLDGSAVLRADYPRLWEWAQTLGPSLVIDSDWNIVSGGEKPYRGCFSYGDGSTTFRLPDHLNATMRALASLSGTDAERALNKAGGLQNDSIRAHDHNLQYYKNDTGGGGQGNTYYLNNDNGAIPLVAGDYKTGTNTGTETRGKNIGMLPKISV